MTPAERERWWEEIRWLRMHFIANTRATPCDRQLAEEWHWMLVEMLRQEYAHERG